jgi:hypothetical protein
MKTIITSVKGPPLRRVLCSFLFGAAALCVVPANIQAGDIVWVTTGNTIAKYNADGTAINTNFMTLQTVPIPLTRAYGIPHLGGILVSASGGIGGTDPILYVAAEWVPNLSVSYAILSGQWRSWYINYVIAIYDAVTGRSISTASHKIGLNPSSLNGWGPFGPAGIALSGATYYVANYSKNSITQGGNLSYINSTVYPWIKAPYALAVNANLNWLYVTNNAQSPNGKFYISTYSTAPSTNGASLVPYFIEIQTGGLNGLALSKDNKILYVSVYSGPSAPGVYAYDALTEGQQPINPLTGQPSNGPFVPVKEPWGIAIGSPPPNGQNPTLYVASCQDSKIYEFDAIIGGQPIGSIKVSGAPTNITVEPANEQ